MADRIDLRCHADAEGNRGAGHRARDQVRQPVAAPGLQSNVAKLLTSCLERYKVDRAFTAGMKESKEGMALITAIITMAHTLGMLVVAEGVETIEQIVALKQLRCDEVQGLFISRPLPPPKTQPILPRWFFPSAT